MNDRRKYDVKDKERHQKLWEKWQLESVIFFAAQKETDNNSQVDLTIVRGK